MMYLDVSKAFVRPMISFPFEMDVPLDQQEVNGDSVTFDPVHVEGEYVMTDDEIHITGELTAVGHAPCAVCLTPVEVPVKVSFGETFRKDADENEDECFQYEGKRVPLDHMVLTLVMLNLPMRFKCPVECHADGELMAWNEAEKVWAEDEEEAPGTYRPFEGLDALLKGQQEQ
jgi:uncharacterized metal-binding protein YceD (DUF177 family)